MADTNPNQEPSMEEILASIRKIISEDGATVQPAEPPADDILELTEEIPAEPSAAPIEEVAVAPIVEMEDAPPAPPPPAPMPEMVAIPDDGDRLISDAAAQASAAALGSLASLMRHDSGSIQTFPLGNGAQTLEAMVVEFVRPYLKMWLDQNLPTLVERIVQKEVQKITRDMR